MKLLGKSRSRPKLLSVAYLVNPAVLKRRYQNDHQSQGRQRERAWIHRTTGPQSPGAEGHNCWTASLARSWNPAMSNLC